MVVVHGPVLVRGRARGSVNGDYPSAHRGAYGIAVSGLDVDDRLLVEADPHWPTVQIRLDERQAAGVATRLGDAVASYPDALAGHVIVDRRAGAASFRGFDGLTPDAIVHPRLGMLAAVYAQWLPGRMAFHAGAFVSGGRAWAVVGDREDGKSTLIAALALAGVPVLGDDTLVLDDARCLPGVRCVDLRPGTAATLGVSELVTTVRDGARERFVLDGDPPRDVPLGGWLFLSWADDHAVRELRADERIKRVARRQGWHRRGVTDPALLLDVAALPAWELERPRDWRQLPRVVEQVRELTS